MKDKLLVKSYTINDIDYIVVNEVDYNANHYVYLSNEFDETDVMIRKVNNNTLEPLESEEELNSVLKLLIK